MLSTTRSIHLRRQRRQHKAAPKTALEKTEELAEKTEGGDETIDDMGRAASLHEVEQAAVSESESVEKKIIGDARE
ncbi:hypothetical protein QYF36_009207 [Acer negundo]|nr:hypothetical protein QYF36_009207 [Acer negundo]